MNKIALFLTALSLSCIGCEEDKSSRSKQEPESASGVSKSQAVIKVDADGLTTEQKNIKKRIEQENTPGAIKHLYIISAMSGQVIIYSTVAGKVTSSSKRLTPTSVYAGTQNWGQYNNVQNYGVPINIGGYSHLTSEVLQDDGTYGSSIEYLFWWDTKGIYHQHYVSGGQVVHVSDQPMPVKNVIINLEEVSKKEETVSPPTVAPAASVAPVSSSK